MIIRSHQNDSHKLRRATEVTEPSTDREALVVGGIPGSGADAGVNYEDGAAARGVQARHIAGHGLRGEVRRVGREVLRWVRRGERVTHCLGVCL
jgi:NADPH:quinone reductase-like Zn-dependent oxidoreductase